MRASWPRAGLAPIAANASLASKCADHRIFNSPVLRNDGRLMTMDGYDSISCLNN